MVAAHPNHKHQWCGPLFLPIRETGRAFPQTFFVLLYLGVTLESGLIAKGSRGFPPAMELRGEAFPTARLEPGRDLPGSQSGVLEL